MGLEIKTADGKSGYFDANAFLQDQAPGAKISDYDAANGVLKFKTADNKDGEFNVKQMLADGGNSITGVKEFNSPVTAADVSPLTWRERWELGALSHEAPEFQQMISGLKTIFGGAPVDAAKQDALLKAQQKRALDQLKTRYDDATIANGEMVVKQNGVWKKVDSSSDSIGEDAAQILGHTGLNLMGTIAGGTAGSAFGPAGTVVGAVAGGMLGETAKEAFATGLAGGQVDFGQSAQDILTVGMVNMAGELIGAGLTKGASKLVGRSTEEAAQSAAIQQEARTLQGMKVIAGNADSKVKDTIAGVYSSVNGNLSKDALREAIDSPDNMTKAYGYSRIASNGESSRLALQRTMADELQEGVQAAFDTAKGKFGNVLKKIQNSVSDDFTLDLEQHIVDLKKLGEAAPRDKRAYFNTLENEADDMLKAMTKAGQGPELTGKKAFAFTQRQYSMISQKLEDVGAYDKMATPGSGDRLLYNAMETIRSYLDDKRIYAAEHAGLQGAWDETKKMYGATKDAMETVWGKAFSNKRDLSFAGKVASGNVDPNVKEALNILNQLHPEAGIQSAVSSMRLKQAGIEMGTSFFRMPELTKGLAGATSAVGGALATGHVPAGVAIGALGAPAVLSPKLAAGQANRLARTSDALTKNALVKAMPAARAKASTLLGMAYSAGFLRTVGQVGARALLSNPDAFNSFIQRSTQLSTDLQNADENKMIDAALQKNAQQQGGQ